MSVRLTGTLTVPADRLDAVRAALPEHTRLSRAEPGCVSFDVSEQADGVFAVSETFEDRAAFDTHQARLKETPWAAVTNTARRDYEVTE